MPDPKFRLHGLHQPRHWIAAAALVFTVRGFAGTRLLWPSALSAVVCLIVYCRSFEEQPRLIYNHKVASIVSRCHCLFRTLHCTPWALSGHVQATLFALWPQMNSEHSVHKVQYRRELVACSDGGQVALDWVLVGETPDDDFDEELRDPIVLHLPGIVGKNGNAYLVRFAQYSHSQSCCRLRSVVKSWRGLGSPVTDQAPRPETWDLRAVEDTLEVAEHLRRRHPHAPLLIIGWSHGGNVALAALAQARAARLFRAGVMVSAPFDLAAAMSFLETQQWFPYTYANTKCLRDEYEKSGTCAALAASAPGTDARLARMDDILSWRNLATHLLVRRPYGSAWHDLFTCRYTGHDSASSYYGAIRDMAQDALPHVCVPTLCFLAEDDPVTPPITYQKFLRQPGAGKESPKVSPMIIFSTTKRGGHCGWFCGVRALSWLDEAAVEFLEVCLQQKLE